MDLKVERQLKITIPYDEITLDRSSSSLLQEENVKAVTRASA